MTAIGAAFAYFAIVFAVGFALGALRVGWLVPALGARWAELLELPLMVAASAFAARWVCARLRVPPTPGPRLAMGALALAMLLAVEFTLVLALRGQTIAGNLASRDPVSGAAYALALLAYALLPWWFGRRDAGAAR
jgi:hypothetical protein